MRRLLFALCMLAPMPALAEDPMVHPAWIDLMREDVRDDRRALTEIAMELDGDKLAAFRTVYSSYETEMAELGDRKVDAIMRYAKAWPDISEDLADELAAEQLDIQKDALALRKKAWKGVRKELGAGAAARFVQVDNQLQLLIDLQIASEMPLIHTLGKPTTPEPAPAEPAPAEPAEPEFG